MQDLISVLITFVFGAGCIGMINMIERLKD
jgi:hypothetical protein